MSSAPLPFLHAFIPKIIIIWVYLWEWIFTEIKYGLLYMHQKLEMLSMEWSEDPDTHLVEAGI